MPKKTKPDWTELAVTKYLSVAQLAPNTPVAKDAKEAVIHIMAIIRAGKGATPEQVDLKKSEIKKTLGNREPAAVDGMEVLMKEAQALSKKIQENITTIKAYEAKLNTDLPLSKKTDHKRPQV